MTSKIKKWLTAALAVVMMATIMGVYGFNSINTKSVLPQTYYAVEDPNNPNNFVWQTDPPNPIEYQCSSGDATCTIQTTEEVKDNEMPATYDIVSGDDLQSVWRPIAP